MSQEDTEVVLRKAVGAFDTLGIAYLMGGGISEQQWNDVQGMLKVQAGALDDAYLHRWAAELEIPDLLDRALAAAKGRRAE